MIIAIWLCLASSSLLVAGERIIIDGKVSAIKDNNGNVKAVSIATNSGEVFKITLKKNGKKLAEEMDGKWVETVGDVSNKEYEEKTSPPVEETYEETETQVGEGYEEAEEPEEDESEWE